MYSAPTEAGEFFPGKGGDVMVKGQELCTASILLTQGLVMDTLVRRLFRFVLSSAEVAHVFFFDKLESDPAEKPRKRPWLRSGLLRAVGCGERRCRLFLRESARAKEGDMAKDVMASAQCGTCIGVEIEDEYDKPIGHVIVGMLVVDGKEQLGSARQIKREVFVSNLRCLVVKPKFFVLTVT